MAATNGGAKLNTPIGNVIEWYAARNSVSHDEAEDIVFECETVVTEYLYGERDDYDDIASIIWDYLGIEMSELNNLLWSGI